MKIVYAVSSGSYSDYRVSSLFEREEDAAAFIVVRHLEMAQRYEEWGIAPTRPSFFHGSDYWLAKAAEIRSNPLGDHDYFLEEFILYEPGETGEEPSDPPEIRVGPNASS